MRARTLMVSGLVAVVAVLGGGGSASAGGGCMHGTHPSDGHGTIVELIDLCFTPTVLHVEPGTEVTWVNRDDTSHEVTGVGGEWGTFDDLGLNDRVSYTFGDDGVYVYSCFIHPGMVGAIVVGSGAGAAGMSSVSAGVVSGAIGAAPPATGSSATDGNVLGALLAGGTAGLVIGGGLAAIAIRRRREAVAVERAAV